MSTSSARSSLDTLPVEILWHIGTFLDHFGGVALAKTCRVLRDPGTRAAWCAATIDHESKSRTDLDPSELTSKRGEAFLNALRLNPCLSNYIHTLNLDLSFTSGELVIRILHAVGKSITNLIIETNLSPRDANAFARASDFYGRIQLGLPNLPNIHHLYLSPVCQRHATSLLQRLPALTSLTLVPSATYLNYPWGTVDVSVPKLKKFRYLGSTSTTLAIDIIRSATQLVDLEIHGGFSSLRVEPALAQVVSKSKNLKCLRAPNMDADAVEEYLSSLSSTVENWQFASVGQPRDGNSPLNLSDVLIPPFEKMKTLSLLYNRYSNPRRLRPTPSDFFISCNSSRLNLKPLQLAPKLQQVEYSFSITGFPETPTHPSQWSTKGIEGMIIRSYSITGQDDEFFHIRAHSVLSTPCTNEEEFGFDRGWFAIWHDFASWRGKVIPQEVVKKLYDNVLEQSEQWFEGGRRLDMKTAGWDLLESAVNLS